jgi:hypothetical protein
MLVLVALALPSYGQLKASGIPPSVTSMGFGGRNDPGGTPPSVTSLGFGNAHQPFFNGPLCCINPLFPRNQRPPARHGRNHGFPNGGLPVYAVPYYIPVVDSADAEVVTPVDDTMEGNYAPGPTIFDRHSSTRSSLAPERDLDERLNRLERQLDEAQAKYEPKPQAASEPVPEVPAAEQPATVLVFRDGHLVEVKNYAIVGDTLFDYSASVRKKIALSDLDVDATEKRNEERGVDFRLPVLQLKIVERPADESN